MQNILIEKLEIEKLFAVIGGSMGGMQALEWAAQYGYKINSVIPIAASYRHSAQNIAFHELEDNLLWQIPIGERKLLCKKLFPKRGLAVARMLARITYLSESALQRKLEEIYKIVNFFHLD